MSDRPATPEELYVVLKKYAAEGPAGFDLARLATTLRFFLVPVSDELNKVLEFSEFVAARRHGGGTYDANDIETCGFVKRALRLYEAVDYEHFSAVEEIVRVVRRLVTADRWPFDVAERDRLLAALAKIDGTKGKEITWT